MSLQKCQAETTSTEFVLWQEYLKQNVNAFHREDYFLANIARLIRGTNLKNPEKVKIDPFLLKFVSKKEVKEFVDKGVASKEMKKSWLSWAGIRRKK